MWTPVCMEPTLKYHPLMFDVLTLAPNRGCGQCLVGSLTGAVSSQRATEEHEGWLIPSDIRRLVQWHKPA